MDKSSIQRQIDLVKDLYNTSFSDEKGQTRNAPFRIVVESKDSKLKVGIHHIEVHPETTIMDMLFALRKSLDEQLKTAPEKQEENQAIQAIEIEFRNRKYHYYPDNLEKAFRLNGSELKDSNYTKQLIQHIKEHHNGQA